MLKVFKGDVRWITREVDIQMPADPQWLDVWTLYRLIVDVPAEHLNLFKTNPPLDLNSLSLVVKEPLLFESFLAILLLFCGL